MVAILKIKIYQKRKRKERKRGKKESKKFRKLERQNGISKERKIFQKESKKERKKERKRERETEKERKKERMINIQKIRKRNKEAVRLRELYVSTTSNSCRLLKLTPSAMKKKETNAM